jgi:hypothetical protein
VQALWQIRRVQAAAQLEIICCEYGMHWLDGCVTIWVLGGYFSGTLVGGWISDNLEFFGEILGCFLVLG